jgi:branched-chain amino acid transport system ATP-binding protein
MAERLGLERVSAGYGESVILDGTDLALQAGESLALLGRNGAGKTTLLRTIMGLTRLHGGTVRYDGRDLARDPPYKRSRAGIAWVPQERGMFPSLSVDEHLTTVARPGPCTIENAYGLFPAIAARRDSPGNRLSGGEQQMLAIARALVMNPKVLLLDEPMEGLAPVIVQELKALLAKLIGEGGMTVVLVEQHARLALSLTARAAVLERGRIVHQAPSDQLIADQATLQRLVAVA